MKVLQTPTHMKKVITRFDDDDDVLPLLLITINVACLILLLLPSLNMMNIKY